MRGYSSGKIDDQISIPQILVAPELKPRPENLHCSMISTVLFLECPKHVACRQDLFGLRLTMDRLDIDISNTQSVTNLITQGHTALSVYDNVALFYTVQEYIMKNEKILGKQILNVYYTKTVCYM